LTAIKSSLKRFGRARTPVDADLYKGRPTEGFAPAALAESARASFQWRFLPRLFLPHQRTEYFFTVRDARPASAKPEFKPRGDQQCCCAIRLLQQLFINITLGQEYMNMFKLSQGESQGVL